MAEAVMLSVVKKLDNLLSEKAGLLHGAKTDVKVLIQDLRLMMAYATDSTRSCNDSDERSRLTNYFISQANEIAHDVETIIETLVNVKKSSGSEDREVMMGRFAPLPDLNYRATIFRKEINFIHKRVYKIYMGKHQFGVEEAKSSIKSEYDERTPAPWYGNEAGNVGLEEDMELLLHKAILNEAEGLYTLCIVGMSGIGKTSLARELYNHPAVHSRFRCRAWVCLSSKQSRKEVLIELIRQVSSMMDDYDFENMAEGELRDMLYESLRYRRPYFIVLDDMADPIRCEPLFRAFPRKGPRNRILLTSRTRIAIKYAQYIHVMKILDHEKSWQLFSKTVFSGYGIRYKCPNHLEKIGKEILTKCNGLPLAIKEAGWYLSLKKQCESEWKEFLKSMDLIVTSTVLESSYLEFSSQLKLCFLTMAFFEERTTIRAEKLQHLWTTGEMISQGEVKSEENARRYIDELIVEYMVFIKDLTKEYRVKNILINANLHRLSITQAEREIGFEILRMDGNYRPSHKPRHRAIYCSRERMNYSTRQDGHLLSLFFRGGGGGGGNINTSPKLWENFKKHHLSVFFCRGGSFYTSPIIWENFKQLKILDFEGFGLKSLPREVGQLITLRYLGLRNNYLQELPHSLAYLKNLEVLDIAQNFMVEVPHIIWELDRLCHLYMSDIICQNPWKIVSRLKILQTLTYISIDNWAYIYNFSLREMTSLRKLGIDDLDENIDTGRLFYSLRELKNLDCLVLRGFRFRNMPELNDLHYLPSLTQLKLDGRITRLPSYCDFPPNISYLTLVNTYLDEDPMPVLGKLDQLFYLKLRNAYIGQEMVISFHSFRVLGVLCIEELWHLRNVRVDNYAMLMLERLEINNCPYLETLPEEILKTNPQELKMVTTKKIAKRIRESHLISKIRRVDIQP